MILVRLEAIHSSGKFRCAHYTIIHIRPDINRKILLLHNHIISGPDTVWRHKRVGIVIIELHVELVEDFAEAIGRLVLVQDVAFALWDVNRVLQLYISKGLVLLHFIYLDLAYGALVVEIK